jgi:hypothetical protein
MRSAILSILAAIALSACATSGSNAPRGIDPPLDYARMAEVDQVAFARGVKVIWVNPPEAKHD